MPKFESSNLNDWFSRGTIKSLSCRLGQFDVYCIDEPPTALPTILSTTPTNDADKPTGDSSTDQIQTILLIHGFPTSSYDFAAIWPSLAKNYRLVALDMLGFGFSDKPKHRKYTIHQQADLFESLIEELGLTSFHVVAHDYGVSVAQELLARQIDGDGAGQWLSCSLLNGGLFPETHRALLIQKLMLSPLGRFINMLTGLKQFSASFSSVFGPKSQPSENELAEFWEAISYKQGRHVFHNLITYILDRQEHRERWVAALQNSPIPLALINGSVDPVSGAHLVDRYKELGCRLDYLKQLPEIGHYPQVEAPSEVSAAILEFIRGVKL